MEVAIVVAIDGRAEVRARASGLDWMGLLRSPLSELWNVVARVEARLLGGSIRRCGIKVVFAAEIASSYALLLYNLLSLHSRERAFGVTCEQFLKFPPKCAY